MNLVERLRAPWRKPDNKPPEMDEPADRIEELEVLADRLKQEAQIHAQEARTANATIAEIYQAVTGSTGEPGNWNGARPVVEKLRALEAHNAVLYAALDAVQQVANNSDGIAGWHLNGDIATWDSILPEVAIALASTHEQSLSSIRRAERERIARMFEESGIGGEHLAEAIRQMED